MKFSYQSKSYLNIIQRWYPVFTICITSNHSDVQVICALQARFSAQRWLFASMCVYIIRGQIFSALNCISWNNLFSFFFFHFPFRCNPLSFNILQSANEFSVQNISGSNSLHLSFSSFGVSLCSNFRFCKDLNSFWGLFWQFHQFEQFQSHFIPSYMDDTGWIPCDSIRTSTSVHHSWN